MTLYDFIFAMQVGCIIVLIMAIIAEVNMYTKRRNDFMNITDVETLKPAEYILMKNGHRYRLKKRVCTNRWAWEYAIYCDGCLEYHGTDEELIIEAWEKRTNERIDGTLLRMLRP